MYDSGMNVQHIMHPEIEKLSLMVRCILNASHQQKTKQTKNGNNIFH